MSIALFFFSGNGTAQVSDNISRVEVQSFRAGEPLTINAELVNASSLNRVEIAYRSFGQSNFTRSEMSITGNTSTVSIPASHLSPPFLEYYFVFYSENSSVPETYPKENPETNPFRVDLQEGPAERKDIIWLSPEPNEHVHSNDLMISFLVHNLDTLYDRSATKIYLDGVNVSKDAVVTENLYVIRPENLSITLTGSRHTIRIELLGRTGETFQSYSRDFSVFGTEVANVPETPSRWLYNSSIQLETRNENIADHITPYNRASLITGASYDQFRINGRLSLTNEEKENRQPQHRYFIGGESPWLKIGYGDSYPVYSDLIMSGKRVRGFIGNLSLGPFHLDVTKGDITRNIESDTIKTFPSDSLTIEQQRDQFSAYGLYDAGTQQWAKFRYGTFKRDITVVRPNFTKEQSRIGFTYLKSSDDAGSIRYGIKPQENLLIGTDLLLAFDDRNVEITAQAAFSATNKDISSGSFSDADIDSIYEDPTYSQSDRNKIRRIRNFFSRFITVNEHLVPLSMKNLSTLAYEGGVVLNYFNNNFRFTYLRRGSNFESFGQPFLRTDIAGFNIADRLRLFENQLLISGGFERLRDNTAEIKPATTINMTANASMTYSPRTAFPQTTVAYLLASNDNDKNLTDSIAVNDKTHRVVVQIGKDFTAGARHRATLSVSTSTRDDQTWRHLDTRNTTVSLGAVTTFNIPLQTTIQLTTSSNKFSSTTTTYTIVYTNLQYRLIEDKLRLSSSFSPTFGDIERTLIDAGVQYYFLKNLSVQSQISLYFNKNAPNTTTWSFILRADV